MQIVEQRVLNDMPRSEPASLYLNASAACDASSAAPGRARGGSCAAASLGTLRQDELDLGRHDRLILWRYLAGIVLLSFVMTRGVERQVLCTAGLAMLTIVIGTSFGDRLILGRFDISYGVYIYAFPIQQIVINRLVEGFWSSMLVSAVLTTLAGILSYYLVERRFLRNSVKVSDRVQADVTNSAVALS
ncbi:hypothetical protein [Bradyrhizobium sp. 45]|uniref:acyltransferase family protein n=1 Tax=Bradyrhizobium sp. 45 TaxID=1043587 RepID=UPI001FFACAA2|nr:hypothetical protein [Bradyrhizobium sp. 45]MCK1305760.1 hypothetical protein [Bradyrhizobium sp. 45]